MKPSVVVSLVLMLFVIFAVTTYVFAPGTDFGFILRNVFYLGAPLIAIIAALYAVWSYGVPNAHAHSITWLGVGLFFWFIGEVIFFSYSLSGVDPFPSIADFFYVMGYIPLAIGFIRESRSSSRGIRRRDLAIFFSLFIFLTIITLYLSVFRAYDPTVDALSNTILIGYGVGDLLLLAAMLPVLIFVNKHTGGYISYPWLMLFLAAIFILGADLLYAMFSQAYDARETDVLQIDIVWIIGYLLFAHSFISLGKTIRSVAASAKASMRANKPARYE